jgi:hypothetical protein
MKPKLKAHIARLLPLALLEFPRQLLLLGRLLKKIGTPNSMLSML